MLAGGNGRDDLRLGCQTHPLPQAGSELQGLLVGQIREASSSNHGSSGPDRCSTSGSAPSGCRAMVAQPSHTILLPRATSAMDSTADHTPTLPGLPVTERDR